MTLPNISSLNTYKWIDEFGEVKRVVDSSGKEVRPHAIILPTLVEFKTRCEVCVGAEYSMDTIRRAKDKVGIELIVRGYRGENAKGLAFHVIYPCDPLDTILTNGTGYNIYDEYLKRFKF